MANLDILFAKVVSAFLLPPLNLLVCCALGIVLLKRSQRLARTVLIFACLVLYVFSTPIIVGTLRRSAETTPPLNPDVALPEAEAIVVLAGGLYRKAPEYGVDTVDGYVLERLRYAARLYRLTGKPVFVTGGSWREGVRPESHAMKESLEEDFHVPVQWVEDRSRTTLENARFSAPLLQQNGIHKIYLVTHALHMRRAREAFERMGLIVIPAPTVFATREQLSILHFLPQGASLESGNNVLYEWLGRLWYALKEP